MPKEQLNISDFTGGLNSYSDSRDIKDNQFSQNWNASLDKYGVIRYTGAGVKNIINHPHTNSTFVPGGGLFAFSYDNYPNVIPDSGNFNITHEEGTVAAYTGTSLTLASSPSKVSAGNHSTTNYYKDMIVSIVEGPGKGQSKKITAYNSTTKVATVEAFENYSSSNNAISSIEGDFIGANSEAVALLRVYNGGSVLNKHMHKTRFKFKSGDKKYGVIDFTEDFTNSTANDPSSLITKDSDTLIFNATGYLSDIESDEEFAYAVINIYNRTVVEIAVDIVNAINNIADLHALGASTFTASVVSDGSANTIIKITDDTKGNIPRVLGYAEFAGNKLNPSSTMDIFQNFQSGYGLGNTSSNTIALVTANNHTLNVGDYITIAGDDAEPNAYNNTYQVLWVFVHTFWIASTSGDTADTAMTFSSLPTSASKYVIYNVKSNGASNWSIDGQSETDYNCNKILSTKDANTEVGAIVTSLDNNETKFLSSSVEVASSNTAQDLGYIELPAQSLFPGSNYELEFSISTSALWQMFSSDVDNTDILPGVLIYSPTAGDGTKNGVLMADGKWLTSNEPISGNELAPFTNKIVNGDFTDITDTSIHVNEGSGETASLGDVTVTVGTASATIGNSLGKIFTTSTGLPIGVCTAVNSTTQIVFTRLETDLAHDAELHTLNGWSVEGDEQFVIPIPKTEIENVTAVSTSKTFENHHNMEQTDGGPDGGNAIFLLGNASTDYIYQDIELDGNCYYHLYFKYATGNPEPLLHEMRYDVYNKETNNSLINGWQTTDSLGAGYLDKSTPLEDPIRKYAECYYRHVNQGYNQGDGNYNFKYVTFFVPPLVTESASVTVSVRFSSLSTDTEGAVALSCVSVKKAFPDIATIVNQQNSGTIPVAYDYGFINHHHWSRDSLRKSLNPINNTYKMNFKIPINYEKKQDWVIRIYGGKFGYTHLNSTVTQRHSRYSPIQIVGITNIKLSSTLDSDNQLNKNLILLNDNLSNKSKIYAYYEEFGFWDKEFMQFNTPNIDPNYIYVNGMLQVSDRNFSNNNPLKHYFYYSRQLHAGSLSSGWKSEENVLEFIEDVSSSEESIVSENRMVIPHSRIFGRGGMHDFIWNRETGIIGNEIVPSASSGRAQFYDDEADLWENTDGYKKWHYEFADWNTSASSDYILGLSKEPQTIPVKWIPPHTVGGGWAQGGYHSFEDGDMYDDDFWEHMRCDNLNDIKSNFSEGVYDDTMWIPGGKSSPTFYHIDNNISSIGASAWGRTNKHCINNPIFIPIAGKDLQKNMRTEIKEETGWDVNAEEQGKLYLNRFEFKLHTYLQGVSYICHNSGTYMFPQGNNYVNHYTEDLNVPKIEVTLYKLKSEYSLDVFKIQDFFKDNPEQYFDSIDFGNSVSQSITYPNANQSFVEHGNDTTSNGTYLKYNTDFQNPNYYGNLWVQQGSGFSAHTHSTYGWSFASINNNEEILSDVSTSDNLVLKIKVVDDDGGDINSVLGRVGCNLVFPQDTQSGETEGGSNHYMNLPQSFGYLFEDSKIVFHETEFDSEATLNATGNNINVNLDFLEPIDEDLITNDDMSPTLGGDNWAGRTYTVACTTVNIFDEESSLKLSGSEIGSVFTIFEQDAPTMSISIGNELIQNPVVKTVKVYMKDNISNIFYLQASIDTETATTISSTTGIKYESLSGGPNTNYHWIIQRKDLLSFNEVDSYESQTLIKQIDAESSSTLTCQYKTAVYVNNKLYVGNIKQNNNIYADRMLKTPIGKYNLFPSTNKIDVSIQDGDEITGLSYYKDRILQFKKKKVFVINVSGDYEFLEDTFESIGVNKQCQIVETPYGIVWVNSYGCFIYNGEKAKNLIDNKIGTEEFQSNPVGTSNNYWFIKKTDIPAIGYIDSTKKLIIARNTGPADPGTTTSEPLAGHVDGFQYDFQSEGWTFLYYKLTASPETSLSRQGYLSNFINNKDGNIIYYAVEAPGDSSANNINSIYEWQDKATTSSSTNNNEDNFFLRTKDFDFGSPGVRKKIYKVYVTFKSTDNSSAAHSNVKVFHATNGSSTFTEFSNDSTNYSTTNGLSDGASGTGWITAELTPSSSINNIYSFAMKFQAETTNIADGFEINDYTIVYRMKNVK